jgi:hypothetical protein
VLRAKDGEGCITIGTSTADEAMPEGVRVGPGSARGSAGARESSYAAAQAR